MSENILNESVSGNEVSNAIKQRVGVLITYKGENNTHTGVRYIEPYIYGATSRNNPAIRAYQYYGDTKKGVPQWKLLRLDRIESWKPTGNKFEIEPKARGWAASAFNGNDKLLPSIYEVVDLKEEPLTYLDKLRSKTRQLQQSEPINISQLSGKQNLDNSKTQLKPQEKQYKGPIGDNTPQNGFNNSQAQTHSTTPNPLNTDGTPKTNMSQAPINQESKKNGPITNTDVNNQEGLIDDKDFSDMINRNFEINDDES